jgi:hypothetical protein
MFKIKWIVKVKNIELNKIIYNKNSLLIIKANYKINYKIKKM